MVEYLTFNRARELAEADPRISENIQVKAAERSSYQSTFLSYSTKDDSCLPTVIKVLESHGASVYIDKKDTNLPSRPNVETAKILRKRIESCHKFVVLTSPNSCQSKWVPWELGYADGEKMPLNIALFPLSNTSYDQDWSHQEYLGLYDKIVWSGLDTGKPEWIVWNQNKNTGIRLASWLV